MNEEVKRLWQERLLDPKSKQTRGWLGRVRGGRCCLGHLCDVAVEQGVIPPPEKHRDEEAGSSVINYFIYGKEKNSSELPEEVVKWAELEDPDPEVTYKGDEFNLSVINDKKKVKLSQIALLIEQL